MQMSRRTPPRSEHGQFLPGHHYSPETQIQRGQSLSTATQFRRGQHHSPGTEFVRGQAAHNRLTVGAETVRKESRTGHLRVWVKIAEPNTWRQRAIVVWERVNGPLPRGHVVHHKDRDTLNDDLRNLVALTRAEHAAEHRGEITEAKRRML